jgi:hypothetical protein
MHDCGKYCITIDEDGRRHFPDANVSRDTFSKISNNKL